jgi:Ca2+:H+ antiporter
MKINRRRADRVRSPRRKTIGHNPRVSIPSQLWKSVSGSWLSLLVLFAPVSWYLAATGNTSLWVFITAAISLIPAAGLIGEATEQLASHSGPTLGGFLNATFGNAAELIIAIVALRAHHVEVVKASITGSIIGNLLLVFGASCFAGGLKHGTQRFNRTAAGSATVMLALAVAALVMPATVDLFAFGSLDARPGVLLSLSTWTSVVLLVVYAAGLLFAFRTNRDPLRGAGHHAASLSRAAAMSLLTIGTLLTTVEAEILVRGLEPALKQFGMSELFAGVIVVALVGNAAEHYSAISAAAKNDMTLALEISVGSSAQIALMIAPLLVLISPLLGQPMSLLFNPFEIAAIVLSVATIALVAMDGESNWLEGLQLLGLYVILAAAFYVIPE